MSNAFNNMSNFFAPTCEFVEQIHINADWDFFGHNNRNFHGITQITDYSIYDYIVENLTEDKDLNDLVTSPHIMMSNTSMAIGSVVCVSAASGRSALFTSDNE